jgi:hypothetical protein
MGRQGDIRTPGAVPRAAAWGALSCFLGLMALSVALPLLSDRRPPIDIMARGGVYVFGVLAIGMFACLGWAWIRAARRAGQARRVPAVPVAIGMLSALPMMAIDAWLPLLGEGSDGRVATAWGVAAVRVGVSAIFIGSVVWIAIDHSRQDERARREKTRGAARAG